MARQMKDNAVKQMIKNIIIKGSSRCSRDGTLPESRGETLSFDGCITGIVGWPVKHSLSPVMHMAAYHALQLNYLYLPFAVAPAQLAEAAEAIRELGLLGVNVTMPHKTAILNFLDDISAEARCCGAVNVVVNRDGRLTGHNTDGVGLGRALQVLGGFCPKNKAVLLLGAGGAAKAAAWQLRRQGVSCLWIANRTLSKAEQLADRLRQPLGQQQPGLQDEGKFYAAALPLDHRVLQNVLPEMDLIVNASPVGMSGRQGGSLLPEQLLLCCRPDTVVCDMIYIPRETLLLQQAKKCGLKTVPGWGMLLYQGTAAFEIWTGLPAPEEIMGTALINELVVREC